MSNQQPVSKKTKKEAQDQLLLNKQIVSDFFKRESVYQLLKLETSFLAPHKAHELKLKLNLDGSSYTNGKEVVVGLFPYLWELRDEALMVNILALLIHELGHVLDSDFKQYQQFIEDVGEYFKSKHNIDRRIGAQIAKFIGNSIEDGRIEHRSVLRLEGTSVYLKAMRAIWWENQIVSDKSTPYQAWIASILTLATTGLWPKGYCASDFPETHTTVESVMPYIQQGVLAQTAKECFEACWAIIKTSEDFLVDQIKASQSNAEEMLEQMSGDDFDQTEIAETEGDQEELDENGSSSHIDPSLLSDDQLEKLKQKQSQKSNSSSRGSSTDSTEESESSSTDKTSEEDSSEKEGSSNSKGESMSEKDDSEEESDSTNGASSNTEGEKIQQELDQAKKEAEESAKKELSRMAEHQKIEHEIEAQRNRQESTTHQVSDITFDPNKVIGQFGNLTFKEEISKLQSVVLPLDIATQGKQLNKRLAAIFRNREKAVIQNQKRGVLQVGALWRTSLNEDRLFKSRNVELSDYAVSILIDSSGSMGCSTRFNGQDSNRLNDALYCAAVIEEGLRGLVPFTVSAFTYGGVVRHDLIKSFKDFRFNYSWAYCQQKAYPRSGNHDGYSIAVAGEVLLRRPERERILFVISDGQPAFNDGVNATAKEIKRLRRLGVKVIGLAIGSDGHLDASTDYYRTMYGKDLILTQTGDMSSRLIKVLNQIIH